jgi:hypothetical protein
MGGPERTDRSPCFCTRCADKWNYGESTLEDSTVSELTVDSPEVRAAVADLSLAVQRALLCIQKHRRAELAQAGPLLTCPTGPAGPTAPNRLPSYDKVGTVSPF